MTGCILFRGVTGGQQLLSPEMPLDWEAAQIEGVVQIWGNHPWERGRHARKPCGRFHFRGPEVA